MSSLLEIQICCIVIKILSNRFSFIKIKCLLSHHLLKFSKTTHTKQQVESHHKNSL